MDEAEHGSDHVFQIDCSKMKGNINIPDQHSAAGAVSAPPRLGGPESFESWRRSAQAAERREETGECRLLAVLILYTW